MFLVEYKIVVIVENIVYKNDYLCGKKFGGVATCQYLAVKTNPNSMPSKQEVYLPPGVTPKDELDNIKSESSKGTIRYPSKQFRVDFIDICRKAKVSANAVLMGFAADFMDRNSFLLDNKNKK